MPSARLADPLGTAPGERCHWMHEALAAESAADRRIRPLDGDTTCDVCVVGAGYTGLWTALRLLEADPALEVVVLEAGISGSGASGRNGGFATAWWHDAAAFAERFGDEQARWLCEVSGTALGELEAVAREAGVGAHVRRHGKVWAATSPAQLGAWTADMAAARRLGATGEYAELSPAEARARVGSPVVRGGVFMRGAAAVQPAMLVRALRRLVIARGARVCEHTPMTALDRGAPAVTTPRGVVRARRVVLATNAWAAALPEIRGVVVPLSSHVLVTERVPDLLDQIGWTGGELLVDSRMLLHYTHVTADGRIAFGRGGGAVGFRGRVGGRVLWDPRLAASIARDLRRFWPALADVRIDAAWGGAVDRSWNHLPFFARLPGAPRVLVGAGYSGDGVVPSVVGGRVLASLALDADDAWSRCALTELPADRRLPPEPLRKVGGELVRMAIDRKERVEDAGGRPTPLARGIARLAWFSLPAGRRRQLRT